MIRRTVFASLAVLAAMMPAAAAAQVAEYKAVEEKNLASGKHALSPDKGYIFIRSEARSNGVFMKTPDAGELAEYEAEWRKQFEKAAAAYPKKLERWKENVAARRNAGEKPEEPTEANFSIGSIEPKMMVPYGPQFVFAKREDAAGKSFEYLIEVEPGEYRYYGPMIVGPNGVAFGACYCMGSVRFEVKAGQITSFGNFAEGKWASREARAQAVLSLANFPDEPARPVDWSVPASLSALPSAPGDLRAAGKVNNVYNGMIARLPPVEGVLRYERDVVIDVREERALAAAAAAAAAAAVEAAGREAAAAVSAAATQPAPEPAATGEQAAFATDET